MAFQYVDFSDDIRKLLNEIFSNTFMQTHSRFQSFEAFQYSSAVFVNWKADQLVYDKEVFDGFVRESTDFGSWEEMVQAAADKRFPQKHN